ncbi:FRAS1-related extracellular matrix protein 2-like [Amphiura filiformis]|uniref:FRAS1-related extracellular matrix protein 2-like n=1 Tax=Amphiura filiformis TaxID=82378 RepID=UPI003B222C22
MIPNLSAEEGADFDEPAALYSFQPMETYQCKDFNIDTDDLIEDTEKFAIKITAMTGGVLKDPGPGTATVYILDETTYFYIEQTKYIFGERAGTVMVRFKRGGYLSDSTAATVDFALADITTTVGAANDYTSAGPLTVSFDPGEHTVERSFTINEDKLRESQEYFTITLGSPVGGFIHEPSVATVCIVDETAWLCIEEVQYFVREKDTSITIRVRRDGYIWDTADLTVDLLYTGSTATGSGTDYTPDNPAANPLTFTAGTDLDFKDIVYTIENDEVLEDTETIVVTLDNPSGDYTLLDERKSTTIYIEDQSDWYYMQDQTYIVGERAGSVTIRVCRDGCIWDAGTVVIALDDAGMDTADEGNAAGDDYEKTDPVAFDVVFTPGDKCVDVDFDITKDTVPEDLEFFTVTLDSVTVGGGVICDPSVSTVFIVDETAIFWLEAHYIAHEGIDLVVTAHRKGYINAADTLTLTATDGVTANLAPATDPADYDLPVDPTLTFAALATSMDFDPITIKADADIEDIEDFTLSLTLTGATLTCGVVIDPDPATVFIFDRTAYFWIEERQYCIPEGKVLDVVFHRDGFLGRVDTISKSD